MIVLTLLPLAAGAQNNLNECVAGPCVVRVARLDARGARPDDPARVRALNPSNRPPYFYRKESFGSASVITPMSVLLNRGFFIVQMAGDYPRDPRRIDWATGLKGVGNSLANPVRAVEQFGGWKHLLAVHVVPFAGVPVAESGWFPNYTGHLIAGGQTYRYMSEWLAAKGMPYPRTTSAVLYLGTQLVNEVIEQQHALQPSAATAIDLYLFDPASILLFNIDAVAKFFAQTVRLRDWSPLASVTFPNFEVQNNGQLMAYKVPISNSRGIDAVTILGITGQLGAMAHVGKGHSVGLAAGVEGVDRVTDPLTQLEVVNLTFSLGMYWDRDDSLLASVMYGRTTENELSVNVYPGVLPGHLRRLGLWGVRTRTGEMRFGVALAGSGVGVGYGRTSER